jgi:hypothetical protein
MKVKPIYSKEFDEGYDAYKQGPTPNPYLALDDPIGVMEWAHGYHTTQWEMAGPDDRHT